jgi:hypothetical protein
MDEERRYHARPEICGTAGLVKLGPDAPQAHQRDEGRGTRTGHPPQQRPAAGPGGGAGPPRLEEGTRRTVLLTLLLAVQQTANAAGFLAETMLGRRAVAQLPPTS